MRRTKLKLYWSELTHTFASKYLEKWTAASRERRSFVQAGFINPMVASAEDIIDSEIDHMEKLMFPQTAFLHEEDIVYVTDPDINIEFIDNLFVGNIAIRDVKDVVEEDEAFQLTDFTFLRPIARISVVDQTDHSLLYGDVIEHTGQFVEVDKDGFPISTHIIDLNTRQITRSQRFFETSTEEIETIIRRTATNDNTRSRLWVKTDEVITNRDTVVVRKSDGTILPKGSFNIINGNEFVADFNSAVDFDNDNVVSISDQLLFEEAFGTTINDVTPNQWNNKFRKFDINRNGTIDEQDRRYFNFFYPSVSEKTGSYIFFDNPDIYTVEYDAHGDTIIPTSFTVTQDGLVPVYHFSLSPDRQPVFYYECDGSPKIASLDDYTYDLRNDVYYVTSNADKALWAIKIQGGKERINFNEPLPVGGNITERIKIPIGDYYDWQVRGVKYKDGFVYVLIAQRIFVEPNQSFVTGQLSPISGQVGIGSGIISGNFGLISGQVSGATGQIISGDTPSIGYEARILIFDTHETFIEKWVDEYTIDDIFTNPTGLSITVDDVFVIADNTDIVLLDPQRDMVLLRDGRLFSHQPIDNLNDGSFGLRQSPYEMWNAFDEYARIPYGISRIPGEENRSLLYRMMSVFRFKPGPTFHTLSNAIQRDLGLDYGIIKPVQFGLSHAIDINLPNNVEIYIDDIKTNIQRAIQTLNGVDILLTNGQIFRVINNVFELPSGFTFITVDIVYPTTVGNIEFDTFSGFGIANDNIESLVDIKELHDLSYLMDSTNNWVDTTGKPTIKLIALANKVYQDTQSRWRDMTTDIGFLDTASFESDITIIPTNWNAYPRYRRQSGVGDKYDLKVERIVRKPSFRFLKKQILNIPLLDKLSGVVSGQTGIPTGMSSSGSGSAFLTQPSGSLFGFEIPPPIAWHPTIRPGYNYIGDREYYTFHNKATQIVRVPDNIIDIKPPRTRRVAGQPFQTQNHVFAVKLKCRPDGYSAINVVGIVVDTDEGLDTFSLRIIKDITQLVASRVSLDTPVEPLIDLLGWKRIPPNMSVETIDLVNTIGEHVLLNTDIPVIFSNESNLALKERKATKFVVERINDFTNNIVIVNNNEVCVNQIQANLNIQDWDFAITLDNLDTAQSKSNLTRLRIEDMLDMDPSKVNYNTNTRSFTVQPSGEPIFPPRLTNYIHDIPVNNQVFTDLLVIDNTLECSQPQMFVHAQANYNPFLSRVAYSIEVTQKILAQGWFTLRYAPYINEELEFWKDTCTLQDFGVDFNVLLVNNEHRLYFFNSDIQVGEYFNVAYTARSNNRIEDFTTVINDCVRYSDNRRIFGLPLDFETDERFVKTWDHITHHTFQPQDYWYDVITNELRFYNNPGVDLLIISYEIDNSSFVANELDISPLTADVSQGVITIEPIEAVLQEQKGLVISADTLTLKPEQEIDLFVKVIDEELLGIPNVFIKGEVVRRLKDLSNNDIIITNNKRISDSYQLVDISKSTDILIEDYSDIARPQSQSVYLNSHGMLFNDFANSRGDGVARFRFRAPKHTGLIRHTQIKFSYLDIEESIFIEYDNQENGVLANNNNWFVNSDEQFFFLDQLVPSVIRFQTIGEFDINSIRVWTKADYYEAINNITLPLLDGLTINKITFAPEYIDIALQVDSLIQQFVIGIRKRKLPVYTNGSMTYV